MGPQEQGRWLEKWALPWAKGPRQDSRVQRDKGPEPECPQLYGVWLITWGKVTTLSFDGEC